MNECCKLYLVPEDVINTWRAEQRENEVDKPVHTLVTNMDTGLDNLLKQDLSDHDKEKLYSQELSKYLAMRDQKKVPHHLTEAKSPPPPSASSFDAKSLLSSIPKSFRSKAEGLTDYLMADKDVEWDNQGHVYIQQKKIEGSHILDLIHDAMRLRKKEGRPIGWQELSTHLRGKNVPKELVGNKDWREAQQDVYGTPPSSVHKSRRTELMKSLQKSKHREKAHQLVKTLKWESLP